VRLVGIDALSPADRLALETAKSIREDFLHQNAFHEVDTYSSLPKQYRIIRLILTFYQEAQAAMQRGVSLDRLLELPVRVEIARSKYLPESDITVFDAIEARIREQLK